MTFFSYQDQIIRNSVIFLRSLEESFSKGYCNATMFFFDYEKWLKEREKFIKNSSVDKPFVSDFPVFIFFFSGILPTSIRLIKIIYKTFRGRHYKHSQRMCFVARSLYGEATFPVYNSCKIRQFNVSPFHKSPLLVVGCDYSTRRRLSKDCGERLSEKTPSNWGCDSLNSRGNLEREIRRGFSA